MLFNHNIACFFSHLLRRVDFDAIMDHLALTHIIKSKMELAPTRIKRLFRTNQFLLLQSILYEGEGYDLE